MSLPTPNSIDQLSAAWIEQILRAAGAISEARVVDVAMRTIGAGKGFLSTVAVVSVHYEGAALGAPASVVVKLEPNAGAFRDAERETGAFEREIRFYQDVAGSVDLRLPRIYHTASSPTASVLVMEDLSHLEAGDQVRGMRHSEVLATVRQIGRLHAAYWNNEPLASLDWLPDHDQFWIEGYAEHWPAFAREFELRIGRAGLAAGEGVLRHLDWLKERIAARPATMIHADLRADNILFGDAHTNEAAVIVDWQLATKSMAAIDPTRLLGGSEPASERKGHHMEVFVAWHETLLGCGVADYAFEDALNDFRLGALYNLLIPVKAHAYQDDTTPTRGYRLIDAMTERMFVSATELDAQSLLPKG